MSFKDTCPIDNWLAISKIAATYYPEQYEEILVDCVGAKEMDFANVLQCIQKDAFDEAKHKLSLMNNLKVDNEGKIVFFGIEHSRMSTHFSFLMSRQQKSVCSSPYCPLQQESKQESYPPVIDDVNSAQEFREIANRWLCEGWKSECKKKLEDTNNVPGTAYELIENTTEQVTYPYCRGKRTESRKMFDHGGRLPTLLFFNIENMNDITAIPNAFSVGNKEYRLLGMTYQKKRGQHYGAILQVGNKRFHYDALERPTLSMLDYEKISNIELQNCIFILIE